MPLFHYCIQSFSWMVMGCQCALESNKHHCPSMLLAGWCELRGTCFMYRILRATHRHQQCHQDGILASSACEQCCTTSTSTWLLPLTGNISRANARPRPRPECTTSTATTTSWAPPAGATIAPSLSVSCRHLGCFVP